MTVVTLITSPLKDGCESYIVENITNGIEDNCGENDVLFLNDYFIEPCQACNMCRKFSSCVRDDDFLDLIEEIRSADTFIFLAPIYFGGISGQAKMFMDIFFSIGNNPDKHFDNKKNNSYLYIFKYDRNIY